MMMTKCECDFQYFQSISNKTVILNIGMTVIADIQYSHPAAIGPEKGTLLL